MQKEKTKNQSKKILIFQEVNFYQVSHCLEIKAVHNQQTKLISSGSNLSDINLDTETKLFLLIKKYFKVLKDIIY